VPPLGLHSLWPLGLLRLLPFFAALDEKQTPFRGKQKPLCLVPLCLRVDCTSRPGYTTALAPVLPLFSPLYTSLVGIPAYRSNPQSTTPTPCPIPIGQVSLGLLALRTLAGSSALRGVRTHIPLSPLVLGYPA
jgi:hypothetical protein